VRLADALGLFRVNGPQGRPPRNANPKAMTACSDCPLSSRASQTVFGYVQNRLWHVFPTQHDSSIFVSGLMFGVIEIHVPGVADTFTCGAETIQEHPVRLLFDHQKGSGRAFPPPSIFSVRQLRREARIMFSSSRGALWQCCKQACFHTFALWVDLDMRVFCDRSPIGSDGLEVNVHTLFDIG
jgi:hypothetical protein